MVLEDDAILVLHRHDLVEGGACTRGMKGYGEHSSEPWTHRMLVAQLNPGKTKQPSKEKGPKQ